MKKLHDYTDFELLKAFVVEVLGHVEVCNKKSLYTMEEEKFCFEENGTLYISKSYILSTSTVETLNGLRYSYTMNVAKVKTDQLIDLLNEFIFWSCNKITNEGKNIFNISFDSHIKRLYKMETGNESSFNRAAIIALLLNVRNKDNSVQTEKSF